jgi:hypothetical protein
MNKNRYFFFSSAMTYLLLFNVSSAIRTPSLGEEHRPIYTYKSTFRLPGVEKEYGVTYENAGLDD